MMLLKKILSFECLKRIKEEQETMGQSAKTEMAESHSGGDKSTTA